MNPSPIRLAPRFPISEERKSANSWDNLAAPAEFQLTDLARLCGVSVRTLQRHFDQHLDRPAARWLRDARLDKARALLKTANSVKSVAYEMGYKQPSHFTREFKRRFGVTPQ